MSVQFGMETFHVMSVVIHVQFHVYTMDESVGVFVRGSKGRCQSVWYVWYVLKKSENRMMRDKVAQSWTKDIEELRTKCFLGWELITKRLGKLTETTGKLC